MSDLIDRKAAIDALEKVAELFPWRVPGNRDTYDRYNEAWNDAIERAEIEIEELPSAQPEVKEIGYAECANAMLKMWIDNVLTDGEYNRVMDRLNAHHNAGRRRAESEDKE